MNIDDDIFNCNVLGPVETRSKECDMHCPDIGIPGNNYWKTKCLSRQTNTSLSRTCYPECYAERKKKRKKQVKSGTCDPYKPMSTRKNTIRQKVVQLAMKNMTPAEIGKILDIAPHKIRDHLNKARRFGEL